MNKKLEKQINDFFQDPSLQAPNEKSNLYFLRKDIDICIKNGALWAATEVIMTGIDLLGQLFTGETGHNQTRSRFEKFYKAYILNDDDEWKACYLLRNALIHNYYLSETDNDSTVYIFRLGYEKDETFIQPLDNRKTYYVNIFNLQNKFNGAIKSYRDDVLKKERVDLQDIFSRVYEEKFRQIGNVPINVLTESGEMYIACTCASSIDESDAISLITVPKGL